MAKLIVAQDSDAHVFYEVNWLDWLKARGYPVDGSTIISITWIVPSPVVKTHDSKVATVGTVWIKNVTAGRTFKITSRITMPEPDTGVGVVTDDFTFEVKGVAK